MPYAPAAAPIRSPRLRVYLLGAFRLERDSPHRVPPGSTRKQAQPVQLPTRKIESLFAFLVLHPEPHPLRHPRCVPGGHHPGDGAPRTELKPGFRWSIHTVPPPNAVPTRNLGQSSSLLERIATLPPPSTEIHLEAQFLHQREGLRRRVRDGPGAVCGHQHVPEVVVPALGVILVIAMFKDSNTEHTSVERPGSSHDIMFMHRLSRRKPRRLCSRSMRYRHRWTGMHRQHRTLDTLFVMLTIRDTETDRVCGSQI